MNPKPPVFDFSESVVVVTGAGGGLGRAIAVRFAERGASVVVHCHRNRSGADQTAGLVRNAGGSALVVQADLTTVDGTTDDGPESVMAATVEQFGRVDVLVNNAGVYPVTPMMEMSIAEWRAVVAANLDSAFGCTQAAARRMGEQGRGAIVNIASIEGSSPAHGHSHYNAAKAGVIMLTRSSALELGPKGIRVNCVSPGLMDRQGLEEAWPEGVASWKRAAPLGRTGAPHEVADACLFLASDTAAWITGANLVVDGGASCRPLF
ncbi:MAG: SDR family oxidoreductase [Spirochaetaceae bacterium]|nr:MAG: SDR family oxidoreductase [Spirochaetaceae bacterium]